MKRLVLSILAVGLTAVAAGQTAASPAAVPTAGSGPVVVLNSQRLAIESAPGKEAYGRLKKLSDQKKDELDKLEKDARELVQKLNNQGGSMPEEKREELTKQADDKQKAWKRMQEDAQKELQEAERSEMAKLESRIGPIVNDYFKEKHYGLVLDTRAGIVYADTAVDVTDDVLKRINTTVALPPAKPASEASKSAPPGAAAPKPTPKKPS
jgi:Skp family chaperone for outer membrane proteins